jgi:hypothetical protein
VRVGGGGVGLNIKVPLPYAPVRLERVGDNGPRPLCRAPGRHGRQRAAEVGRAPPHRLGEPSPPSRVQCGATAAALCWEGAQAEGPAVAPHAELGVGRDENRRGGRSARRRLAAERARERDEGRTLIRDGLGEARAHLDERGGLVGADDGEADDGHGRREVARAQGLHVDPDRGHDVHCRVGVFLEGVGSYAVGVREGVEDGGGEGGRRHGVALRGGGGGGGAAGRGCGGRGSGRGSRVGRGGDLRRGCPPCCCGSGRREGARKPSRAGEVRAPVPRLRRGRREGGDERRLRDAREGARREARGGGRCGRPRGAGNDGRGRQGGGEAHVDAAAPRLPGGDESLPVRVRVEHEGRRGREEVLPRGEAAVHFGHGLGDDGNGEVDSVRGQAVGRGLARAAVRGRLRVQEELAAERR